MMKNKIENIIPVLPVKNLNRSVDYYVNILGFKEDWRGVAVGSVSCDGCSIMLSELIKTSHPNWVWIGLQDATVFEELMNKGVKVIQEPMNHDWAYEMKFEDLDGNVLWLGTGPRDDLPKV
ncbi:VOC family protein [Ulvibacterium sp.]|uniref:VOC family protein n=1 Tax=Ulvibacterium sp. TaxID=2665914 RepID=UPI003BACE7A4